MFVLAALYCCLSCTFLAERKEGVKNARVAVTLKRFAGASKMLPIHCNGQGCFGSNVYSAAKPPQRCCLQDFFKHPASAPPRCESTRAALEAFFSRFKGAISSAKTPENCPSVKGVLGDTCNMA